ncbi:hypothetical protein [Mycoplasmoides fastidiosum]|uniref:hypothetical protein n=1 Tax=Mycoplasmoides fastidiosum TaxID=92758 RepID=UPI0021151088|nr:hypothetical protein [Mycoplasmoides fastidiosum]UUD37660.1 hypothetical protein NPA10_03775 [Mycoplasmoides fastidiosum]
MGFITSGILAACAPTIQTSESDFTDNQQPDPFLNPVNKSVAQLTTSQNNHQSFRGLQFSSNFYKNTDYQPIGDFIPEFKGFDSDVDVNYWLTAQFYRELIAKLTADDLQNDILDNLKFLVFSNPQIEIDFEQLKLSFELVPISTTELNLQNFNLQFLLTNTQKTKFDLFNAIPVKPNSQALIQIEAPTVSVTPWYKKTNTSEGGINNYFSSWKILNNNNQIDVSINYLQQFLYDGINIQSTNHYQKAKTELFPNVDHLNELEILTYRSFVLNTYYTRVRENYDFKAFHDVSLAKIKQLSPEQLKKDLLNSRINLQRIYYANISDDITSILNYFITPNIRQIDGRSYSLLDLLYHNTSKEAKEALLENFDIPKILKELLINIFTPRENEQLPPIEEIYAFIKVLLKNDLSSYVYHHLDIELDWIQDPKLNFKNPNAPKVSMEYTEKITFKKELNFPLKGSIEIDGQIINYDVTKLFNPMRLLAGFGFSFAGTDSFDGVISKLLDEFNLDNLKIAAGTTFTTRNKVENGNLMFHMPKTFDVSIASNTTLGWQIDQVQSTFDLSGLYDSIMPVFKKFNEHQTNLNNTNLLDLTKLSGIVNKLKKGDFNALFEVLTFFYVPNTQKDQKWINETEKLTPEELAARKDRPVETLVKKLLGIPITFTNAGIEALTSSAFYQMP